MRNTTIATLTAALEISHEIFVEKITLDQPRYFCKKNQQSFPPPVLTFLTTQQELEHEIILNHKYLKCPILRWSKHFPTFLLLSKPEVRNWHVSANFFLLWVIHHFLMGWGQHRT